MIFGHIHRRGSLSDDGGPDGRRPGAATASPSTTPATGSTPRRCSAVPFRRARSGRDRWSSSASRGRPSWSRSSPTSTARSSPAAPAAAESRSVGSERRARRRAAAARAGAPAAIASPASAIAFGLPGKLTIRVRPRIAATPRESIQCGVCSREASRIASAIPGASRSIDGAGRLGGDVVGRRSRCRRWSAPARSRRSSPRWRSRVARSGRGRRRSARARRPRRRAPRRRRPARSPLSSSPSPAAREVLIVRIAARSALSHSAFHSPLWPPLFSSSRTALDLDAALDPLDHVVDGQRRDRRGGHRLHLDPGPADAAGLGGERRPVPRRRRPRPGRRRR